MKRNAILSFYCIKFLVIIILLISAYSCQDKIDDEPNEGIVIVDADEVITYQIYLSEDRVCKYYKFINDSFSESTFIIEGDSIVELVRLNAEDQIIWKAIYMMGNGYLAQYSYDTIFDYDSTEQYISITNYSEYHYNNYYLKSKTVYQKTAWMVDDSLKMNSSYGIHDGNTVNCNISISSISVVATYEYQHNNELNKLDFLNGILGKPDLNMRIYELYLSGMYSSVEESSYDLNSDDLVVTKYDLKHSSSAHPGPGANDPVTKVRHTTHYEYVYE